MYETISYILFRPPSIIKLVACRTRDCTLSQALRDMPLNVPGLLAPFQLLFRPYLVIPSLVVKGALLLKQIRLPRQLTEYKREVKTCDV